MRNIAVVYDRELDMGGVESHLLSLFRNIDRAQFAYTLIAPLSKKFRDKAALFGVRVIPFRKMTPLNCKVSFQLVKIFRRERVDLVHIHSPTAAIHARLAAKFLSLPSIVTVHAPAMRYYGTRKTIRSRVGRLLYINIDRVLNYLMTDILVYVSRRVYSECVEYHLTPPDRSIVVPNGVDLAQYQLKGEREQVRSKFNLHPQNIVITFVGRLDEQKGVDILIEAASQMTQRGGKNFVILLIGDGPVQNEMKAKTAGMNLETIVRFAGLREDVPDILSASDIFVLPSRNEAMPIVILEALAAGLPCVVTDVGENANVIEHGVHGFVVPVNRTDLLAEALNKLIKDPELARVMGMNAREKSEFFNVLSMVERTQQVYSRILNE